MTMKILSCVQYQKFLHKNFNFERKMLRRIYGSICEGVTWRSRHNEELYRLNDETDVVTTIRITRLRWAGPIV